MEITRPIERWEMTGLNVERWRRNGHEVVIFEDGTGTVTFKRD